MARTPDSPELRLVLGGPRARHAAVKPAARRPKAEGAEELVTLQFYATPGSAEVGAILTFSDRTRMMEHVGKITGREGFEGFFATVGPLDVRV